MSKIEFIDLKLKASIIEALVLENIISPTEVQEKAIPFALAKRDLIVQSETGTGKTLAYLLPFFEFFQDIKSEAKSGTRAIVLVPTHELAIQVQRQIERLAQNSGIDIRSAVIIGNVNIDRQIEKLREKPQIIVGSAGRILEIIKMKKINSQGIKYLVLDEADRLMSEDNIEGTLAVIKTTQKDRQLLAFSATIPNKTVDKLKEIMNEPEIIKTTSLAKIPDTIEHLYKVVEKRDKNETLRKLIRSTGAKKSLIFINNNFTIEDAYAKLNHHGIKTECIHGTNRKSDRKRTMEDYRNGKVDHLIASDLAARGLQIEGITHVFNVTMTESAQDYLHRAGRTGRNGNTGVVISIVTEYELEILRDHAKKLHLEIKTIDKGNSSDTM